MTDRDRIRRAVEESRARRARAVDAYRRLLDDDRLDDARLVRFACPSGCSLLDVFAADGDIFMMVPAEHDEAGEVVRGAYIAPRALTMNPPARCEHRGGGFLADEVLDAAVTRALVDGPEEVVLR